MWLCPRAPHASLTTAQFASILVAFHDVPPAASLLLSIQYQCQYESYYIIRPNLQITTPTVNYTTYISDSQQLDPQCCHAFIWPTRKKIECPTPDNWYHNVAMSTEGSPKCKLYVKFRIRYVLSIGGCRSKQNDFWVCWPPWIEHVNAVWLALRNICVKAIWPFTHSARPLVVPRRIASVALCCDGVLYCMWLHFQYFRIYVYLEGSCSVS